MFTSWLLGQPLWRISSLLIGDLTPEYGVGGPPAFVWLKMEAENTVSSKLKDDHEVFAGERHNTADADPGALSSAGSWHQGSLAVFQWVVCLHKTSPMEKGAGTHKLKSARIFKGGEGSLAENVSKFKEHISPEACERFQKSLTGLLLLLPLPVGPLCS